MQQFPMKVSKRFRWEGAHRLPWHQDGCQNLHGHSYEMWVELTGTPSPQGMVLDFKAIKKVLAPLVEAWDHAVLVAADDHLLMQAVEVLSSKHFVLPYDTTSENLCRYVVEYLCHEGREHLDIQAFGTVRVRVKETETCYAELEMPLTFETPQVAASAATMVSLS